MGETFHRAKAGMNRLQCWVLAIACLLQAAPARTQELGGLRMPDASQISQQVPFFAAALSQLLSDSRPFVATAEVALPAEPGESPMALPFGVAMLDGKMRWELDAARLKGGMLEPSTVEVLKQLKLDRLALIIRPETNLVVVFPSQQAYFEMAPPKADAVQVKAQDKIERLQKKLVGREVVDGMECLKYQLTVPDGKLDQAFVWTATKLKDFPIKLTVHFDKSVYGLHFTNIRMGNPDARYFVVPAGFTRHAGPEAMMQSMMIKSLGEGGAGFKLFGELDSALGK
jgi:hypothetical protein